MTDSVFQLKEVVARGTQAVSPHQTISQEQLSALASNNVADALKYLAGVQIKDYGGLGGQKTVNVRSLGSQHVGVYLDGVRITNAQNGTVDLGKYSLTTLESVSLFNANKTEPLMTASEYASASTIYLRTRRPDSTSLTASYGYGSFNTHKANITYSYKRLALVDAQYTHTDGNYPFRYHTEYEDTTGRRRNSDLDQMRIEGVLFHGPLQWHTYYYLSYRGLPGGIVRRLSDQYTDVGREWDQNFFTQLSWQDHFGPVGLRAIAKYANDRLHYRSDYDNNISVHSNVTYHQQDAYAALAASYTYKDFGISLSPDLRWSDLTADMKHFSYVYRWTARTRSPPSTVTEDCRSTPRHSTPTAVTTPGAKPNPCTAGRGMPWPPTVSATGRCAPSTKACSAYPRSTTSTIRSRATDSSNPNTPGSGTRASPMSIGGCACRSTDISTMSKTASSACR